MCCLICYQLCDEVSLVYYEFIIEVFDVEQVIWYLIEFLYLEVVFEFLFMQFGGKDSIIQLCVCMVYVCDYLEQYCGLQSLFYMFLFEGVILVQGKWNSVLLSGQMVFGLLYLEGCDEDSV